MNIKTAKAAFTAVALLGLAATLYFNHKEKGAIAFLENPALSSQEFTAANDDRLKSGFLSSGFLILASLGGLGMTLVFRHEQKMRKNDVPPNGPSI